MLDAARDLLAHGYSVIPIRTDGPMPLPLRRAGQLNAGGLALDRTCPA